MELAHPTDAVAALAIDRDDGFAAQLKFVAHVDESGIDRAGRARPSVEIVSLRLQAPFDQGDQPVDKVRQAFVRDRRFRYGMLYWIEPPQTSDLGFSVPSVTDSVGTEYPT
jgi:hypothetical protein